MLEKGIISANQYALLVLFFMLGGSPTLYTSAFLAREAKQNVWIAALIGFGVGILFVLLFNILAKRLGNMSLIEYCEAMLGRWLGIIVSLSLLNFTFFITAGVLRNIAEFITIYTMPETPMQAIIILYLIIVVMGTKLGIEVIGRSAELLFPWMAFLWLFGLIALFPRKSYRVFPYF